MATTYTVLNDKAYKITVTLDPEPTGPNQQIKVSYNCQFVYTGSYSNKGSNCTLSYNIDGGNWVTISNGGVITTPNDSKNMRVRLNYKLEIDDTRTNSIPRQTITYRTKYLVKTGETASGGDILEWVYEDPTYTTTYEYEEYSVSIYSASATWSSDVISLNNNPTISGKDSDLGEKSTAFNVEYSVNDTDTSDAITIECYYDDVLTSVIENAIRNHKYQFMISNAMLAPSAINSSHTIKIVASDGKGSVTRTYTFIKNRNPEPYMDYTINPVQTDGMATTIVVGQLAGQDQNFQANVYACNNAFDEQPMWEDMSSQYYQGLSYSFVNTVKTADKWGVSVRFVNSKLNENDQIDIVGCGFWCDKMIVRS